MTEQLFTDYIAFVQGGFNAYLPILITFVSVTLTFAIANQLVFFIRKTTVKGRG
jgi:hypothetical protein